jgi:hypothetical protein
MSTVNKNIAVEAKLISPPTYVTGRYMAMRINGNYMVMITV